jgi:membrane peptidoglycan carboxypeptidase
VTDRPGGPSPSSGNDHRVEQPPVSRAAAPREARRLAAQRLMNGGSPRSAATMRAIIGRDRATARARKGSRTTQLLVGILSVFLVGTLAMAGIAAVGTAAAVAALSQGLPDPTNLAALTFSQPTIVYDRTGKVQLGVFQREQRRVVSYDEVPKLILDATTTAEDRTFWQNSGFDPAAILSAVGDQVAGVSERGASTITQQLVRARLLPDDVIAPGANRYVRKAKELIQASRLTGAFPGETGKQQIMTAYLNEIFYGHDAYGIAAAARIYFGVSDLDKLTIAQAALLAGLPKAPSTYDPYRYAEKDKDGKLVVPPTAAPVVRRDYILRNLSTSRWTRLTETELNTALDEPVILRGDVPLSFRAPHFTWQVRRQLRQILGPEVSIETGGYRVITTLDWKAETLAEKWLAAAAIAPNLKRTAASAMLKRLKVGPSDRTWINALRGKDLHNGSLVALDYRTGDVLAYVGSAGYYQERLASRKFEPKYDAAGDGARQPGSAFKPIVYASAFDARRLTPGSLLLDITTEFGRDWAPRDADQLDRGPVLVRKALQYSLNVPAIRALQRVGNQAVAARAKKLGIRFTGGEKGFLQAGLAGAIGTVEVRTIDLTSAFGALGNGGLRVPPRMILEVRDAAGKIVWTAPKPKGTRAVSPQAAFLVSDILQGNTLRSQNPIWAAALELRNGPRGEHRPAAVKTGTANDARDLATYGYLAPPKDAKQPAYAVGIWMGNSDHSNPKSAKPATSLTAAAPLWRAFVRDLTARKPVASFAPPKGVVKATIDAWSGGARGPWTRETVQEWFINGTQPGGSKAIDVPGLLYSPGCGGWRVNPLKAELGPGSWDDDVADWLRRARRGVGVQGRHDSRTAYFWQRTGWGGPLIGTCAPRPRPPVVEPTKPPKDPGPSNPPGGGGGGGGSPKPPKPPAP